MWTLFHRNLRLLVLSLCVIIVWGLFSYVTLPRLEDPLFVKRHALITTVFPGANAARVESLVSETIEEKLFEIPEIKTIESTSSSGLSTVYIELKDRVNNSDVVWTKVRDKLADVSPQLPQNAKTPEFQDLEVRSYGMILGLTWESENPVNYSNLNRLGKQLRAELRNVKGTEKIDFFGMPTEEILVEVDPSKLPILGLTVENIAEQIKMSDASVAAGKLRSDLDNFLIEIESEIDTLERIRQIPIGTNNTSYLTYLKDIAKITKGIKEPASDLAIIDGKPAISLALFAQPDIRIDIWSQRIRRILREFQAHTNSGVNIKVIFDASYYINELLFRLFKNFLLAIVFVLAVTWFMMGWRSTLIISSSLPLSILAVMGAMKAMGVGIDRASFTGVIIALGLLIDNAIVVTDEIQHQLNQGREADKAITATINKLAIPLISSTLTTILAFCINLILGGDLGDYVSPIGMAVILALVSSLIYSLMVIPTLAVKLHQLKTADTTKEKAPYLKSNISNVYNRVIGLFLSKPVLGILFCLVIPLMGMLQTLNVEQQFFPPTERDNFQIEFELAPSASLEQTQAKSLQMRQLILNHSEVKDVDWFIGRSAPSFYYNLFGTRTASPNYAQGLVQLKSQKGLYELVQQLQNELDTVFPEARILVRQLENGTPFAAPIEIRLYGSDIETLQQLSVQIREELFKIPDVTHTRAAITETLSKLTIKIDEEQAKLTGLDKTSIARQLDANLEGIISGSVSEDTEELPIRVRISNFNRSNLSKIASLEFIPSISVQDNEDVKSIPLTSIGKIDIVPEPAAITRRNGKRVSNIQGFIAADALAANVLGDFKKLLKNSDFKLPPGYSFEFGGEVAERLESIFRVVSKSGIMLLLMGATLVISFNSLRLTGIVACVAMLSAGMGLASLSLFGYPLGFMSLLGTTALIGIAVNDSIVILAAIREDTLASEGDKKAIRLVIVRSTRHIVTTTLTTTASFLPLVLAGGLLWSPMAIVVVAGVWGSTFLALLFVPCAYLLLMKSKVLRRGR